MLSNLFLTWIFIVALAGPILFLFYLLFRGASAAAGGASLESRIGIAVLEGPISFRSHPLPPGYVTAKILR